MPLLWLSLAFLSGILAADWMLDVNSRVWLVSGMFCLAGAFFEKRFLNPFVSYQKIRGFLRVPVLLLATGLLAGAARYQAVQPYSDATRLAYYNGKGDYKLTGIIANFPDRRSKLQYLHIEVEHLAGLADELILPAIDVEGRVRARVPLTEDWQYGDRVTFTGRLLTPPEGEGFSYRDYLAGQGIFSIIYPDQMTLLAHGQGNGILGRLYAFRQHAYEVLNRLLPQPEAGLLAGILLGIENDLSESVEKAFQDSGTYHIIAISGFNIAIIAGFFIAISRRILPRRWALPVALVGIGFYTLLVGAQPSVVRAAIMGVAGLLGRHIGRKQVGLNSLAFTAGLMCLGNPRLPWDVGFQLSFSATLGLVLFGSSMQTWFEKVSTARFGEETSRRLAGPVSEYILFTLAAQLATAPVLIAHFQRISLSALVANPLILPPQPLVMILGGVTVLAGIYVQPVGQVLAYLLWPVLSYTIRVAEWAASIPGGVLVTGRVGLVFVILYYGILLGLFFVNKMPRVKLPVSRTVVLAAAFLAACAVWRTALDQPDGRLHLVIYSQGGEPSFLIETPGGRSLIINCSGDKDLITDQLGRRINSASAPVDGLIITKTTPFECLAGLPDALQRDPVDFVFSQQGILDHADNQVFRKFLEEKNTVMLTLVPGMKLDLGEGAYLQVLAESSQGAAFLLEWDKVRILVPDRVVLEAVQCASSQKLKSLSGLILSANDLEFTTPGDWSTLHPAVLLVDNGEMLESLPNAFPYQNRDWIELETDGSRMWLSASPRSP